MLINKIIKMMHLKLSLYFFLTLFISCSVFQNNNKKSQQLNELEGLNNYQKKPLVKMRKTPCFGKCPYFEVSIFDDGLIKYLLLERPIAALIICATPIITWKLWKRSKRLRNVAAEITSKQVN